MHPRQSKRTWDVREKNGYSETHFLDLPGLLPTLYQTVGLQDSLSQDVLWKLSNERFSHGYIAWQSRTTCFRLFLEAKWHTTEVRPNCKLQIRPAGQGRSFQSRIRHSSWPVTCEHDESSDRKQRSTEKMTEPCPSSPSFPHQKIMHRAGQSWTQLNHFETTRYDQTGTVSGLWRPPEAIPSGLPSLRNPDECESTLAGIYAHTVSSTAAWFF